MCLVHIIITKVSGYDNFTLHFDDRSEKDSESDNPFSYFEKEFLKTLPDYPSHPEFSYNIRYCGYIIFPELDAYSIYDLYYALLS